MRFRRYAARLTALKKPRSAAGSHAIDVGQNAVTPNDGIRRAISATASSRSKTSMPSSPCTCTSMNPGTT
jgi:hypothetical protein